MNDQHDIPASVARSLDNDALAHRLGKLAEDIRWTTPAERAALLLEASARLHGLLSGSAQSMRAHDIGHDFAARYAPAAPGEGFRDQTPAEQAAYHLAYSLALHRGNDTPAQVTEGAAGILAGLGAHPAEGGDPR